MWTLDVPASQLFETSSLERLVRRRVQVLAEQLQELGTNGDGDLADRPSDRLDCERRYSRGLR